ncbi:mucin-binding protein [Lactobacillus crispatus]|uniref:mucin-binding protein n=1 Tax=Lactobacillus crispatus TaxID=47770 RepID=UPI0018E357BA|nr:YSIRK-type signal peptide-containing protein [Lactobacillus crispatus]MBI1695929.1 mucus-binding protein [Lactobacillus crispatus]
MLFNKHSETKQRFGIRKLTIGACSVLLSTLFLTVNNGQKVNAATGDTVTNADNNKTETDNESVTKENEATKTNNDSSVSLNKDATEVTNTSNGTDSTEKQTTETEIEDKSADATTNGSPKADDTKATEDKSSDSSSDQKLTEDKSANNEKQNQQQDKTATDAKSSDTSEKSEKAVTTANNKLAKAVVKLAVTPANNKLAKATVNKLAVTTDDSTPVLSQSTENGDMTLSISLPELSNKDYIPQTIKLNATNVNSGDKIVIKVKKGSAYGFDKENFPIGTVTDFDQGAYKVFQIVLNTTGKFEYKIIAKRNNNYLAQPSPMEDTGVTTKDIQWSINGEDQAPLSFKQTIIPELISNGVSLATATGDKNTDFTEVAPNEDYNFVYVMGENDGLVHDGSYMAGVVNSAVNYGTKITIPVPENFLLNQEASDKANKERGLTGFTMTQDGMGKDIIITVPKGQSGLAWNHRSVYYTLTGKFVYDQIPEEPTTVATKRDSVIDQIYTSDGQRITAKGKPFSVTISGKKGRPASGPLSLSVSGAISNNQLLLDSNPNNDPVAVNWFGYSNNYDDIENAKIKLDLADGLYVTGIKTPKDLGTVYNNIGNIQSYTYEMTLTNGQKITGTVKAGDIAKSTVTTTDADNKQTIIGIRNIVFTPDTNTIGKDTKTDNLPNPGSIADQEDRIDGTKTSNVFIALGHLSHTYDNGSQVKANDKLTSSITIFGSNFRPGWNNKPIVSYTSSNTQTVFDTSQYKASLNAYNDPNYTSTQPGKENAGTISLNNGDGRSNYDYIFEPIFYYVVPDNAVYSGGTIRNLNHNGNDRPEPVVSTYFVNGHQIVKLDYSNTNYYYNTKVGTTNAIPLDNANNQPSNTSPWEIYVYSKDIPLLNNSYTSGKFLTPENAEKSGSTVKLDPSKFYYVGGGTWTINTASATVLADAANGNKNSDGLYVQNGTSDDKGSDGMNFRVNVVNYDMTTDLKDLTGFINLPVKGYNNTTTNFFLSGPVDVPDGTVLYSTSSTDLPSGKGAKTPSTDNFLTKEQVEAKIASHEMSWSDVKSIAVKYDTVKANSATKDIYIQGTDPDITTDAGKVAQISWGLYGGNDMPPLVKKNASSIVISGSSTVKTRLHYIDPKGKDQYVDVPTMSKTYKDNDDQVLMRESDFNEGNIPASLIPKGYELVLKNENGKAVAVKKIIDNGGKTWVTGAEDGSAQFDKVVLYNFDGDTVQFELTPKIDKATQTVNRTVHFVSDGDNPQKLANDAYQTATITESTNEVTGKKQYSATITAGGVTTDAPVVVGQDGQISISFPATTIPGVNNYYVVDSTKSEADAISPTFTFTKDGELPIENTVKYAPVKQELQVKVYDDDADDPSQALDTTETGATVDFTGDSFTNFPSDVATNVDSLIKYYTDRGYLIKTKPSDEELSGKFDGDKTQTQYLKLQLVHDKATVSGEDENTPAPDTPINENDPDGVKYPSDVSKDNLVISSKNIIHYYDEAGNKILDDKVNTDDSTLTRTVTIDKVTGKVTNTSDWTGGKEYENVNTPVVNGYYVDKASASVGASTVTPADANSGRVHDGVITNETTVIYHPMGHIIPIDKSGNKIPGAETPIFTNDTKDPTKASTTNSPIIPGYHLETPSDSAITPDEPGNDRPVVYVADTQELKVQVFDLDGDTPDEPLKTDKTGATVDFTGDSFTNFPSDVATNVDSLIKYYTDRGYLIKTKPSDEELSGKFDGDKTQTQYLKLQLVHDKATVSGEDENTPAPDTPINENDPDGVKYPSDVSKDNLVISSKNIIHYYDEAGNKILDDKVNTDDSTLTRTVTIDKVTGKVTNTSDWTGGKEYENVNTPVVNGYYVDKASASAGASTVTPADANSGRVHDGVITNETTVIYHPMGHIIPIDKSGNKIPGAETPIFTNDTKDPTKASTTNSPIIPGYHLETPSDSAITPDEPGKDRPVVYVADKQQLILKVHDEDTQSYLGDPVIFDGYTDQEVGNSPVDKLEELKKKYLDLGYEIVEIPQLDKNYDDTPNVGGEPDKEPQVFVLKVKHRIVPVTPDDPKTPDDIIPDSNQNYPGGLTETDLSRTITRTIVVNFPSGTSQEIKQVVTYTRTATVDAVTKEVKYSAWTTKNSNWPKYVAPVVPGYTPDKDMIELTYVPADGKDVTVEINYTADPEPDEPTTPVKPGEPITPDTPTKPTTPTKPVKPTKPSKPKKPAKQTKPEVVKPVKETKGKQLYGSAQAKVDSKAAQNVVDKANRNNDKKLPQTNGESNWQLSLLGVGVLALALLVLKKKRDDE